VAALTVWVVWLTVKPLVTVAVPPGVVTATFLAPNWALLAMVMLAVIWVALLTVTVLTVMPLPKFAVAGALKQVPVMMTFSVCPTPPQLGLIEITVGTAIWNLLMNALLPMLVLIFVS
jgi:hypothetical protein